MIDLAAALVGPVAKLLLKSWLGETGAELAGDALDVALDHFKDRRDARKAEGLVRTIATAVAEDLTRHLKVERADPTEVTIAVEAFVVAIERRADAGFLISARLDEDEIERMLREARPTDLPEPAAGYFDLLARAIAPRLKKVAPELEDYGPERDAVILARLEQLARDVPQILAKLDRIDDKVTEIAARPQKLADAFEQSYLEAIVTELDKVEILGLDDIDERTREAKLSIAYLSLTARLGDGETTRRLDFATLMALLPLLGNRLLIEGPAGSGKTTLTRWAVIECAKWRLGTSAHKDVLGDPPDIVSWIRTCESPLQRASRVVMQGLVLGLQEGLASPFERGQEFETAGSDAGLIRDVGDHASLDWLRATAWRARLPILVPLRRSKGDLQLEKLPEWALDTASRPPEGWLTGRMNEQGASIFLVFDGIDEVPTGQMRRDVIAKIENYAKRFPKAQIIVTGRPGVLAEGALEGFRRVELDELTPEQCSEFISHWHKALANRYRQPTGDKVISALEQALEGELKSQRSLTLLASNPLLCAAICALHHAARRIEAGEAWSRAEEFKGFEGQVLPTTLWALCENLTRMLVHKRDWDRKIRGEKFGTGNLDNYDIKLNILACIAHGMVSGKVLSAMSRVEALQRVKDTLRNARTESTASADDVLTSLLERSGVLRGSHKNSVEFLHNTLKTFLASLHYLRLNDPRNLAFRLKHAVEEEIASGLDEIAVLAAASPHPSPYAEALLRELLAEKEAPSPNRRLLIVAMRCEAAATGNLPQALRREVRALAPKVFPPRDLTEATQLAPLGDEVVSHLRFRKRIAEKSAVATARCLRLIGTSKAMDMLRTHVHTPFLAVAEELPDDIDPLIVSAVLEAIQTGEKMYSASPSLRRRVQDLSSLQGKTELRELHLGGTGVTDQGLVHLAMLTGLQVLSLSGTRVTDQGLSNLTKLTGLRELRLGRTDVTDEGLAHLAKLTGLRILWVYGTGVTDRGLAHLAKLTGLQFLLLANTGVTDQGLVRLTKLTGLRHLLLGGTGVTEAGVAALKAALAANGNGEVEILYSRSSMLPGPTAMRASSVASGS